MDEKQRAVKRRKRTTTMKSRQSLDLMSFLTIVYNIYKSEVVVDSENKSYSYKSDLSHYFSAYLSNDPSVIEYCKEERECEMDPFLLKQIMNDCFNVFEANSIVYNFSREALFHILCIYKERITHKSFKSENIMNEKAKFSNISAALLEYSSPKITFEFFRSWLLRVDQQQAEALKFAVDKNIHLPKDIYAIPCKLRNTFTPPQWTRENKQPREGYRKIGITATCKPQYLLITKEVMMIFDNPPAQQFIDAPLSLEQQIPTSCRKCLESDDYVILEYLNQPKVRIIDIVQRSMRGDESLDNELDKRLIFLKKTFDKLPIIDEKKDGQGLSNYIAKPMKGFGECFIYNRYSLTAAVIGLSDSDAVVAFLNGDCLVVTTVVPISGNSLQTLLVEKTHPWQEFIKCMGQEVKLTLGGDFKRPTKCIQLFDSVIAVELRDGVTKLGNCTSGPISSISEYKIPNSIKKEADAKVFAYIDEHLVNSPEGLAYIINNVKKDERFFQLLETTYNYPHEKVLMMKNLFNYNHDITIQSLPSLPPPQHH